MASLIDEHKDQGKFVVFKKCFQKFKSLPFFYKSLFLTLLLLIVSTPIVTSYEFNTAQVVYSHLSDDQKLHNYINSIKGLDSAERDDLFTILKGGQPSIKDDQTTVLSLYNKLMKDTGRQNPFNNKEDFFNTVVKRTKGISNLSGDRYELDQIYKMSSKYNLNPLILVSIWYVESGFTTAHGCSSDCPATFDACLHFTDSYNQELLCATYYLNRWMKIFAKNYKNGKAVPITVLFADVSGATCYYRSGLPFAYEAYTPECHYRQNPYARNNFLHLFYIAN